MKFLKTGIEMSKKSVGIRGLLEKHVGGFEPARSKVKIHASDLTKEVEYCPREVRLMELLGKKQKDQWIPFQLRVTFDEGNWKQWQLNNVYLRQFMAGRWRDPVGINITAGWTVGPPDDNPVWEYKEPFFKDPISEAQGSVDGLVKLPEEDRLRLMECKIASQSVYEKLLAPLAEHKLRTQFYLALIARSDHPHKHEIDTSKASVLYWLRGYGKKCTITGEITPFKEFVVKRNDDAVEYLFVKALELTLARGAGPLPDQICPHQMCPRAEKCPVSKECFSYVSSAAS